MWIAIEIPILDVHFSYIYITFAAQYEFLKT